MERETISLDRLKWLEAKTSRIVYSKVTNRYFVKSDGIVVAVVNAKGQATYVATVNDILAQIERTLDNTKSCY